jgi:hypothetical protein
MQRILIITLSTIVLLVTTHQVQGRQSSLADDEIFLLLKTLLYNFGEEDNNRALQKLDNHWEEGMIAPLVEIKRISNNKKLLRKINKLLQEKTGRNDEAFFEWMDWLWNNPPDIEPYYYEFKAEIYKHIDERFPVYFKDRYDLADIRLEEIVWGGVQQDGIPPLRQPKLLNVSEADYLSDTDIVFGAYINGVAKAYPKRILAWHEMFVDNFGDDVICGVYCTLCGTVIAYDTEHKGIKHDLGTSGFLYRSNKLMYDKATQSLWNTIEGTPVLGPLVGQDIVLDVLPIVTSTWGEWKKIHPNTQVLSLDTGHERNYDEGNAYKDYFATDKLMFPVPKSDQSLANKDEVLIIRSSGYREDPLAISIKYLKKKKWYIGNIGSTNFVVITDESGASRVYNRGATEFSSYKKGKLIDHNNQAWTIEHDKITSPDGTALERLPSHNTFWFAWYNTYPNTRLIK